MAKIFLYDLETTGLNPDKCAIHQMAVKVIVNGYEPIYKDFKIRPFEGAEIHPEALKVGGVTLEQIMEYPEEKDAFRDIIGFLTGLVSKFDKADKMHLCGYNICAFDNKFLRELFIRNNDKFFGSYFWSDSIDVFALASNYLMHERHLMPNFKQATVADWLGIEVDQSRLHEAMYDLELCSQIKRIVS